MQRSWSPRTNRWIRILGVVFVMHVIAFVDRNNIAMGIPAMRGSLGLSAKAMGFATGSLFFTYIIMQIPAGRLASAWSAKKVILISSIVWGLASLSTAFVTNEPELVINRLTMGLVEGGETVTMIFLIRQWFVREERARALTCLMLGLPVASMFSSLISGYLLVSFGWQMMFIIEAIPAFIWAGVWWFTVADKPAQAEWVPAAEKLMIATKLAEEERHLKPIPGHWLRTVTTPSVMMLTVVNLLFLTGNLGVVLWLPSVLKEGGLSTTTVGNLSALTYVCGAIGMILTAISSDHFQERKWHAAGLSLLSGVFLALVPLVDPKNTVVVIILFCLVNGLCYARYAAFWAWPSEILPAALVGVGVGTINGLGNLGGFIGPYIFGYSRTVTNGFGLAIEVAAGALVLAGVLSAFVRPPLRAGRSRANIVTSGGDSSAQLETLS